MVFLINQLPREGNCSLSQYNGTCLSTLFRIQCFNWKDPDGYVDRYEYLSNFK
jgi:hypothetical protein